MFLHVQEEGAGFINPFRFEFCCMDQKTYILGHSCVLQGSDSSAGPEQLAPP